MVSPTPHLRTALFLHVPLAARGRRIASLVSERGTLIMTMLHFLKLIVEMRFQRRCEICVGQYTKDLRLASTRKPVPSLYASRGRSTAAQCDRHKNRVESNDDLHAGPEYHSNSMYIIAVRKGAESEDLNVLLCTTISSSAQL